MKRNKNAKYLQLKRAKQVATRNEEMAVRHERSFDFEISDCESTEAGWRLRSAKNNLKLSLRRKTPIFYHLIKIRETCGWGEECSDFCTSCSACRHQFKCECEDYRGGNMCKHIHFLTRYIESQSPRTEENLVISNQRDEQERNTNEEESSAVWMSKILTAFEEAKELVTGPDSASILLSNLTTVLSQLQTHSQQS